MDDGIEEEVHMLGETMQDQTRLLAEEIRKIKFERGHVTPIGYRKMQSMQHPESSQTLQAVIRWILVLGGLAWFIAISVTQMDRRDESVVGVYDVGHIWTEGLNRYFREHREAKNALEITCGVLMDILVMTQLILFIIQDRSWLTAVSLLVFYAVRGLIQVVCSLPFPEGYSWDYPGYFNLFVPYSHIPDFFFSGHVGSCVLHFLLFQHREQPWGCAYAMLTMVAQITVMYATRTHYTIDMIAGVLFGAYIFTLTQRYICYFDYYVFGNPKVISYAVPADRMEYEKRLETSGPVRWSE